MKIVCCKCKRAKKGRRWTKSENTGEKLSHGYCPACFKPVLKSARTHIPIFLGRLAA